MAEMDEFTLALPFDSDDPEFIRGVEVGMLWERLGRLVVPDTFTIHASNAEMAMRCCEATGHPFTAEGMGGDFIALHVGRKEVSDG